MRNSETRRWSGTASRIFEFGLQPPFPGDVGLTRMGVGLTNQSYYRLHPEKREALRGLFALGARVPLCHRQQERARHFQIEPPVRQREGALAVDQRKQQRAGHCLVREAQAQCQLLRRARRVQPRQAGCEVDHVLAVELADRILAGGHAGHQRGAQHAFIAVSPDPAVAGQRVHGVFQRAGPGRTARGGRGLNPTHRAGPAGTGQD
ncbi:hypothetical protein CBM2589_B10306 [Cupriavidus taiwanensis]|uniref:Uncharacterized protein n=1 Tax=Cupriavidus taiwanensis TaxID=164546 RepID=A0A975ZVB1_9BURK|nr:hypothetical protein CBM2589_B10306 [Cupriavidus taiwanensis]